MNRGAATGLLVAVALTALLPHIPYARIISLPLLWFSTLAHECGHGVTAMLVGGEWRSFQMNPNAGGFAVTATNGRVASALVAAGGLVGPAVVAAVCFVLARTPRGSRIALGVAAGLAALVLLTKAANLFAVAYLAGCAAVFGLLAYLLSDEAARIAVSFLGVQLGASVFSRGDYLFSRAANVGGRTMDSDVQHMAQALWMPYWFWGAACGIFSIAVLIGGLWAALVEVGER